MTLRLIASLAVLAACNLESDEATDVVDTGPSTTLEATFCDDAPVVTWANFGESFVLQHCDSCHRTTTPDRQGAPESVNFDTEADTLEWSERILARAAIEEPDMPPQGGVEADDRYLLEVWLSCEE